MEKKEGRKSSTLGALGPEGPRPHRHLSASASALLGLLREQARPTDLATLATLTARHPNTVREQLDVLVRSGLAARHRARPAGRGRPAWLYEATSGRAEATEYAGLAGALATAVGRTSAHPRADAARAGEDWGRELARQRGARPTTPVAARDRAIELLDDLGFEPRTDPASPSQVRLGRCPLLDAARRNPKVVCSVHLGLLRGVLAEYGADATGSDLVPFAEVGACVLVVPPVA